MTHRRLILLRHAKSAWPDGTADRDRPLAPRGQKAAPRMGAYMAEEKLVPDLVLVSTARRAQETWALIGPHLPKAVEKRDIDPLYEAPANRLLDIVRAAEGAAGCLMLVGHNPGLQQLALAMTGAGDEGAIRRLGEKFPTAALAVLDFSLELWPDVHAGMATLERFIAPKSLD